ncbi:MAG: hypothetical protein AB7S57_09125 [Acetobacteraceae bacterium]
MHGAVMVGLPVLGAGTLWVIGGRIAAWIDFGVCLLTFLVALSLLWASPEWAPPPDLSIFVAILASGLATLRRWPHVRGISSAGPARAGGLIVLAAILLAAIAPHPLLLWFALVFGSAGAFFPNRVMTAGHDGLAGGALCLMLFGLVAMHVGTDGMAITCVLLGIAALVVLVPDLMVLLPLLVPELRALADAAGQGGLGDSLLLAVGLGAALACGGLVLMRPPRRLLAPLLQIGQAGLGVFAFGLGSPEGWFAGFMHLTLLAIARVAEQTAHIGRVERVAALAGLGGLPPFGVWPALMLVLAATAHRSPWLVPPVGLAIGLMAWATLTRLPRPGHARAMIPTLSWVPLGIGLVLGWAMPAPLAAWLQALVVLPQ